MEVKAGGITIHHGTMLHASAPNSSATRSRRLYLLQYCAADAWPIKNPPQDMAAFDACIIRGKPVAAPRHTDVPAVPEPEVIRPGRSGSIYESQTQLNRPMVVAGTADQRGIREPGPREIPVDPAFHGRRVMVSCPRPRERAPRRRGFK